MFSETIRRYGFWTFDALSGGHVRKYLQNIKKKLGTEEDVFSDELRNILDHAVNTTGFYKGYKGYSNIKDFPVIKKSLIKEKYDQFISSEYKNKSLYKMQTSGTTGERFVMLLDKKKRKRVIAELIYFFERCGFKLGYKHVYARVLSADNKKIKLELIAQNKVWFDCSFLSDASMETLYEMLHKDKSIKCLIGYANFLTAIAAYFDKKNYTPDMFNIEMVVSGAERLEPEAKDLLKKIFGCTVVSRYGNIENGILAQQTNDGDNFFLNTAHYFFETLKLDSDEPAPFGELARLVVTDLYNYAMPLIRYDTDDIVVAMPVNKGSAKMLLTELSGRKEDIIYDTRGNMINPCAIALGFRRYDLLPRFQFIQESPKGFTLKLEGARGLYEDKNMRKTVEGLVGQDAVIKIEHLDKIPHLSSGKFRKIICKYKKQL